jgi:hypothetical protein
MATISIRTIIHKGDFQEATSDPAETADTVDIDDLGGTLTHNELSVKMYDVAGEQIVDSAGSFAVLVATRANGVLEAPPIATIDATAPTTLIFRGNITRVQVIPSSLVDAITWEVVLTSNRN